MVDVVKVSAQFFANNLSGVPAQIDSLTKVDVYQPSNLSGVDDRYSIITSRTLPGTARNTTGFVIPLSRRYRISASVTPPRAYTASTVTLGSTRITFICGNYGIAIYKIRYDQTAMDQFVFPITPIIDQKGLVFASNTGTINSGQALTDFSTSTLYEVEVDLAAGDYIYFGLYYGLYPSPNNGSLIYRSDTGFKPKVYANINEVSDI